MVAAVILILLAGLTAFLLWTPMVLRVDTARNDYSFRWRGIGRLAVVPDDETLLRIRYRIFF
jgi:hypothetical protein